MRADELHIIHCQIIAKPYLEVSYPYRCEEGHIFPSLLCTALVMQIYNNNPNAVDELLAYGKVEFGELMTRTNSEYKLRLRNSLEEPINSYLFIEHYDANPADLYLPLDDRTCIKLRLINDLPQNSYFICEYGENSFNLSGELN